MSDGCKHKFIDSNHCLKCGWTPPSSSPAATGSAMCADGGRCKGSHPIICQSHGCAFYLALRHKNPCAKCHGTGRLVGKGVYVRGVVAKCPKCAGSGLSPNTDYTKPKA